MCTHYIYAYAILNPTTFQIQAANTVIDVTQKGYLNFTGLKTTQNSEAKFLLAIGGASDSGTPSTTNKYSKMAFSRANIYTFTTSVVNFLKKYQFDGLSLDWFYPTATDQISYSVLLTILSISLRAAGLMLSATVSGKPYDIDAGRITSNYFLKCFYFAFICLRKHLLVIYQATM